MTENNYRLPYENNWTDDRKKQGLGNLTYRFTAKGNGLEKFTLL